MIRTFIAFDTTPDQKHFLADTVKTLMQAQSDVRWESPEKYHVTLKFLGDTEERNLPAIRSTIIDICSQSQPLGIEMKRLGCFPSLREPRIVWAGCTGEYPALNRLKDGLDRGLARFGFEIDRRAFHPHITLGRVKGTRNVDRLISTIETVTFEPFTLPVRELLLIQSELRREGSVYTTLGSTPLGGNPA